MPKTDELKKSQRKSLAIFGATGSIGASTLKVVQQKPDHFYVDTLVSNQNIDQLIKLSQQFKPKHVVIADESLYQDLKQGLSGTEITCAAGLNAVIEAAERPVNVHVAGITGLAGLAPTMAAVGHCQTLALANKESVVCAGSLLIEKVANSNTVLIPVDSEHNALHQLLKNQSAPLKSVTLTASGGPFLDCYDFSKITPAQAVKHPQWDMGAKISVDSATLMNKGLEVIEAAFLFDLPLDTIKVLVHPQSIVHAMATLQDGTMLACMGQTDMQLPIAYALYYPEHAPAILPSIELDELTFSKPDHHRFPSLNLAYQAYKNQQCTVLNGANEAAVAAFLNSKISFVSIPYYVEKALEHFAGSELGSKPGSLDEVFAQDHAVRRYVNQLISDVPA